MFREQQFTNMESAFQQALKNIKTLSNYSPQNIATQAQSFVPFLKTIPKTVETKIVGALDRANEWANKPRDVRGALEKKFGYDYYGRPLSSPTPSVVPTRLPTAAPTAVPTRIPTPTPVPGNPTREELIKALEKGSKGAPISKYAAKIIEEQMKYPIYEKYPFLTVAQSHLESRGLRDFEEQPELVNKPKQALGWGVFVPTYNPKDIDQAIIDFISAIGGRTAEAGFDPGQIHNSMIYEPFRQGEDLKWYSNKYAGPVSKRNPNAGDVYASNLASVMNEYAAILDELMKERGTNFVTRY